MKFSLYKILTKIPAKQDERLNFRKYKKLDFEKYLILVSLWWHEPLNHQPHKMVRHSNNSSAFGDQPLKMVRHTQTIRRILVANCLSFFDHLVGLTLKRLIIIRFVQLPILLI